MHCSYLHHIVSQYMRIHHRSIKQETKKFRAKKMVVEKEEKELLN